MKHYSSDKEYINALENTLLEISRICEDTNWGWDGDCGVTKKVDEIIESVFREESKEK